MIDTSSIADTPTTNTIFWLFSTRIPSISVFDEMTASRVL